MFVCECPTETDNVSDLCAFGFGMRGLRMEESSHAPGSHHSSISSLTLSASMKSVHCEGNEEKFRLRL